MGNPRISEDEVLYQIRELWPGLGDHARHVLWRHTSYPFSDSAEPMAEWMEQVERYVKERAEEWQLRHG